MNLADFVPVKTPVPGDTKFSEGDVQPALKAVGDTKVLQDILNGKATVSLTYGEKDTMRSVLTRTQEALAKFRTTMYDKYADLPPELKFNGDALTNASNTPRLSLAEARKVVDGLGLAMIPWTYFNHESALRGEDRKVTHSVNGFVNALKDLFNLYVICPVLYYSVSKHVHAPDDLPIYACRAAAQAFMGVNMAIPMFRNLVTQVNDLDRRQRETDKRVGMLDAEVKNLARRVEQLNQIVEQEQRAGLTFKVRASDKEIVLDEGPIVADDPMLLAVPKSEDVTTSNKDAIVGPCWGKDFQDVVIHLNGWKKRKGQREMLDGHATSIWMR